MWIENFKITSYITLQSNNDDGSNFYVMGILPLGKQNQNQPGNKQNQQKPNHQPTEKPQTNNQTQ